MERHRGLCSTKTTSLVATYARKRAWKKSTKHLEKFDIIIANQAFHACQSSGTASTISLWPTKSILPAVLLAAMSAGLRN
jgi:hypothetical protein